MKKVSKIILSAGLCAGLFLLLTGFSTSSNKRRFIGSKNPNEPKEIGDVVFKDGSASPYTEKFSDAQKDAAEAVIFYTGDGALGRKPLGVSVKHCSEMERFEWAPEGSTGCNTDFKGLQCTCSKQKPESGTYYEYVSHAEDATHFYYTGKLKGRKNWDYIKSHDPEAAARAAEKYPAFNYVNVELGKDYWLPTVAELMEVCKNKTVVNNAMTALGKVELGGWFWTSSQYPGHPADAYYVEIMQERSGYDSKGGTFTSHARICGIRAF